MTVSLFFFVRFSPCPLHLLSLSSAREGPFLFSLHANECSLCNSFNKWSHPNFMVDCVSRRELLRYFSIKLPLQPLYLFSRKKFVFCTWSDALVCSFFGLCLYVKAMILAISARNMHVHTQILSLSLSLSLSFSYTLKMCIWSLVTWKNTCSCFPFRYDSSLSP